MVENSSIERSPICIWESHFRTCAMCYGKRNCCKSLPFPPKHKVFYVEPSFEDWNQLEMNIWNVRHSGKLVRLIVDKEIPSSILWAASYDSHNLIQINVDLRKQYYPWVTNLAHAAERCGLYFIVMVYPIVPEFTKTKQVLEVIDSMRMIPYCQIMLKFADFKNSGRLATDTHLNVNGKAISKTLVCERRHNRWKCTDSYKQAFLDIIRNYADGQQMKVEICERW